MAGHGGSLNETLEHIRAVLLHRQLSGEIRLECREGRVEKIRIEEVVDPPWKARLKASKARAAGRD